MRNRTNLLGTAALAAALCGNAGCSVIGTMIYNVTGPPPVNALFDLPEKPTIVLVENYTNPDGSTIDADQIAHQVTDQLKDHTKVTMLDPDKLSELREQDPAKYHKMSIEAIGKAVDAKQVVFVDLVKADTSADATGSVVHSVATAHVRVIDIDKNSVTIWPTGNKEGKEVSATEDFGLEDTVVGRAKQTKMLSEVSDQISKLFYRWNPEDMNQATE
jgi:hypothetical protein